MKEEDNKFESGKLLLTETEQTVSTNDNNFESEKLLLITETEQTVSTNDNKDEIENTRFERIREIVNKCITYEKDFLEVINPADKGCLERKVWKLHVGQSKTNAIFVVELIKLYSDLKGKITDANMYDEFKAKILKSLRISFTQPFDYKMPYYNITPPRGFCYYMSHYQAVMRMKDDLRKPLNQINEYFYDDDPVKFNKFLDDLIEFKNTVTLNKFNEIIFEEDRKNKVFNGENILHDEFKCLIKQIKGNHS